MKTDKREAGPEWQEVGNAEGRAFQSQCMNHEHMSIVQKDWSYFSVIKRKQTMEGTSSDLGQCCILAWVSWT